MNLNKFFEYVGMAALGYIALCLIIYASPIAGAITFLLAIGYGIAAGIWKLAHRG